MQMWHYIWWCLLPALGIDFGRLITNLFDAIQQIFNIYGALVSLWLVLVGEATVDYEGVEIVLPIGRGTAFVCLANFVYDWYKTR